METLFKMKHRFVIIGSNSFSGSNLIDLLLQDEGNEILGLSRSREKGQLFLPYKCWGHPNFQFHQMNLNTDLDKMLQLFDKYEPHYIVNFASQSEVAPSWEYPEQWYQTNCMSIVRLSNELKDRKYLKCYVHISTPEVYGSCPKVAESAPLNPSTPYAASRAAADMFLLCLARNFDFPLTIIRSTNVYGAHQQLWKIIPRTVIYLKQGRKIELHGGGDQIRSFIHIRDVTRGILKAIELGKPGSIYHLSPQNGCSIKWIVQRVCELMGYDFDKATVSFGKRAGQDACYIIDSSKARTELGWHPQIPLDEGLKEVIQWVEENWEEISTSPLEYIHKAY